MDVLEILQMLIPSLPLDMETEPLSDYLFDIYQSKNLNSSVVKRSLACLCELCLIASPVHSKLTNFILTLSESTNWASIKLALLSFIALIKKSRSGWWSCAN